MCVCVCVCVCVCGGGRGTPCACKCQCHMRGILSIHVHVRALMHKVNLTHPFLWGLGLNFQGGVCVNQRLRECNKKMPC